MKEFKFLKRSAPRPILRQLLVDDRGIIGTDLETYLLVKGKTDYRQGLHDVELLEHNVKSGHDVDDYPLVTFNDVSYDKVTMQTSDVKKLIKFASKDETRIQLNGMFIGNGDAVCVDGHTLHKVSIDKTDQEYIIPRTSLTLLIKLLKSTKEVTFSFNDSFAIVDTDTFTMKMRLINREFPKYNTVIPATTKYEFNVTNMPLLKDIKPLLNKRTNNGVELIGKDGIVTMFIKQFDKSFVIGNCAEDFNIGFNALYIYRAIETKQKEFVIKYNGECNPIIINESVIMPLKL